MLMAVFVIENHTHTEREVKWIERRREEKRNGDRQKDTDGKRKGVWRERERERERDVFNDALNTFYLRLYGVINMVKNHSDSERGNPLRPLNGLLFPIISKGFIIYVPSHRHDNTYHGLC